MSPTFASQGDLADKKPTFEALSTGIFAYTTEGDPNVGLIVGDTECLIIDTRATPALAQEFLEAIRSVTDKPIGYAVLTHYHAVRVLGASAYGVHTIIASQPTFDLIQERGAQDFKSEVQRFPRLFQSVETIPGLTFPNLIFEKRLTLQFGQREIQILHLGKGHTQGDTVVWLPQEKILFSGDLVEYGAAPYTGDAHLQEWPETLEKLKALQPNQLVPGRGETLRTPESSTAAIEITQQYLQTLWQTVVGCKNRGCSLKETFETAHGALKPQFGDWVIFEHCLPFNVSRAYDEASGIEHPLIWTAERDLAMWNALHM